MEARYGRVERSEARVVMSSRSEFFGRIEIGRLISCLTKLMVQTCILYNWNDSKACFDKTDSEISMAIWIKKLRPFYAMLGHCNGHASETRDRDFSSAPQYCAQNK